MSSAIVVTGLFSKIIFSKWDGYTDFLNNIFLSGQHVLSLLLQGLQQTNTSLKY